MFFSGLDLGQSADYTALTVTEQKFRDRSDQNGIESFYEVRWLQRETLGTPYPDQVRNVSKLYRQAPLKGSKIAVDYTGVGRPVLDLLTEAKIQAIVQPVLVTSGNHVTQEDSFPYAYHTPKLVLVSTLSALLQFGRIRIAKVPNADVLRKELEAFKTSRTKTGHEQFAGVGTNDDLVFSLMLAVWYGEQFSQGYNVGVNISSGKPTINQERGVTGAFYKSRKSNGW